LPRKPSRDTVSPARFWSWKFGARLPTWIPTATVVVGGAVLLVGIGDGGLVVVVGGWVVGVADGATEVGDEVGSVEGDKVTAVVSDGDWQPTDTSMASEIVARNKTAFLI